MNDLFFQPVVVPSQRDYFILPRSISTLCYKMVVVQYRFFYYFLQQIEDVFQEQQSAYKQEGTYILPSQTKAIAHHLDKDGFLNFRLNLGLFGNPNHYGRLREYLVAMNTIQFIHPYTQGGVSGMHLFSGIFHVDVKNEGGKKRSNTAVLGMHISDLDHICCLNLGFHRQAVKFLSQLSCIYTARLYSLAKAISVDGMKPVAVRTDDFFTFMGLYDTEGSILKSPIYKRYCDLKKGALDPAKAELKTLFGKGYSDIWVEVSRKDLNNENQYPSAFIITIHRRK